MKTPRVTVLETAAATPDARACVRAAQGLVRGGVRAAHHVQVVPVAEVVVLVVVQDGVLVGAHIAHQTVQDFVPVVGVDVQAVAQGSVPDRA